MKIVIVGSYRFQIYAPALANGFRSLGHEVIEIDYDKYHLSGNSYLASFLNKFQDRFHYGLKLCAYNKTIEETVKKQRPDMVFLYRCYNVFPSTLKHIRGITTIFSYNNDDPFSNVPSKFFFKNHINDSRFCNINFVYRKKNVDDYKAIGINNTRVLLPYYLGKNNYYEDVPDDIAVAFAGHFENDGRDKYIKALKDAGVPITVFNGSYWDRAPLFQEIKEVIKPGVKSLDYNHTLNRCQIALVFLSKLNHDTYTRRCFEIPATKTLMLCEYTDDMNLMYPADDCAVYFRTPEELVEKSIYLLSHPNEIRRIAQNGYDRLLELGGSEIDRCKEIIGIYKNTMI